VLIVLVRAVGVVVVRAGVVGAEAVLEARAEAGSGWVSG